MKLTNLLLTIFTVILVTTLVGCSNEDDETMAQVRVNGTVLFDNDADYNGDISGDFTGNGGSVSRTFVWFNNLTTADYNADITATAKGTFQMLVMDANGNTVLNKSLSGSVDPDSFSGVTNAGTSGEWSVTITVGSFKGDGSFSLSQGD